MKQIISIDNRIKFRENDLFDPPIIIRINEFEEDVVQEFAKDVSKAHSLKQPFIPIIVDSLGGNIYELLGMISEIKNSKIPIITICESKAMSCGAVLFSCGTQRYVSPYATLLIHDLSAGSHGKNEEIKSDSTEFDRLNKLVYHMMAENCGKPKNYFLDIIHKKSHADWYITAKEALKHKLATKMGTPTVNVNINLDITLS